MYFVHTETLQLVSINEPKDYLGKYIILSHTWGIEEVLFNDIQGQSHDKEIEKRVAALEKSLKGKSGDDGLQEEIEGDEVVPGTKASLSLRQTRKKKGWSKVEACCKEAAKYGIPFVWIDTCCINKDSSTELSEAINSMFAWYRDAKFCLAYLGDAFIVEEGDGDRWRCYRKWILSLRVIGFNHARWFKRGWTLQELIAPKEVLLFDKNWEFIGPRTSLAHYIAEITHIDKRIFEENGLGRMAEFSVVNRLWAAKREVT
jgi:hypothetical protein